MVKILRFVTLFLFAFTVLGHHKYTPAAATTWQQKVDESLLNLTENRDTELLVFLDQQADLSRAEDFKTKQEKGAYVYQELKKTAKQSQKPVLDTLEKLGVEYQSFWVANMIWVSGNSNVLRTLAQRNDVAHIFANPQVGLKMPVDSGNRDINASIDAPSSIEWNIEKVGAPLVWEAGYSGGGVVIGGHDTGYAWQHPALKNQYRGWDGENADHNYNWHDAIHSGGGSCGPDSPEPCDDDIHFDGHGTHTMGVMVGDDGIGNQIGMAPGARWIGCRNMNEDIGSPATYSECFQWFIAPTNLNGENPETDFAPDIVNNSWSCTYDEGCTTWDILLTVTNNTHAAGILVVSSVDLFGEYGCDTVVYPPGIYESSLSVGATDTSDIIAPFSSRGPSAFTNLLKPNVTAPGVSIRSSSKGGGYHELAGTSTAAPHVAGLAALLLSARPELRGQVDKIEDLIEQNALPLTSEETCGGIPGSQVPNNTYGWGRIAAYPTVFNIIHFPIIFK